MKEPSSQPFETLQPAEYFWEWKVIRFQEQPGTGRTSDSGVRNLGSVSSSELIVLDEGVESEDFKAPCCCCSVAKSCLTLCNPMDCSTPGFPVHHQLLELTQTHIHPIGDAIQPSHPLSSPSPPAFTLSQHWGLFQWVRPSHQVAKVLELQH